ncbi:MAG: acyloxyacyl hydrolase [Candidatus Igneacidithiobacillus chanchocoensis]
MERAYHLAAGQRLGVKIAHLSNGDLSTRNPGENEILVTYSVALR